MGDDRLRAIELLTVLVDAELAAGDVARGRGGVRELVEPADRSTLPTLRRAPRRGACRGPCAASGDLQGAMAVFEATVDEVDPGRLPWLRATLLIELARLRERAGDVAGAAARRRGGGGRRWPTLDVVLSAAATRAVGRLDAASPPRAAGDVATLTRDGKWWTATCGGMSVAPAGHEGPRVPGGADRPPGRRASRARPRRPRRGRRRTASTAGRSAMPGALLDAQARSAYRRRIEALRADADDALAAGLLETGGGDRRPSSTSSSASWPQAFGLGGRDRRAASAAERARLNVTRALRAAIVKAHRCAAGCRCGPRSPRPHRPVLRVRAGRRRRCDGSFSPD